MADYPVVRFIIMEERPFIKQGSLKSPQNGFSQTFLGNGKCRGCCGFGGYTIEEAILELTKQGTGMTTLFLLVTGVCQSPNELGVVSVTKK